MLTLLRMRFFAFLTAGLLIATTLTPTSLAAEPDLQIRQELITPRSGFYRYGLKRLREKVSLFALSLFPLKKAEYYLELFDTRLAELKQVVDNDDRANIEKVSVRYFSVIGQGVEYIMSRGQVPIKMHTVSMM